MDRKNNKLNCFCNKEITYEEMKTSHFKICEIFKKEFKGIDNEIIRYIRHFIDKKDNSNNKDGTNTNIKRLKLLKFFLKQCSNFVGGLINDKYSYKNQNNVKDNSNANILKENCALLIKNYEEKQKDDKTKNNDNGENNLKEYIYLLHEYQKSVEEKDEELKKVKIDKDNIIKFKEEQINKLTKNLHELEEKYNKDKNFNKEKLKLLKEIYDRDINNKEKELKEIKEEYDRDIKNKEIIIEELKENSNKIILENIQIKIALSKQQNKIINLENEKEDKNNEIEKLNKELLVLKIENKNLVENINKITEEKTRIENKLELLNLNPEKYIKENSELKKENEIQKNKINDLEKEKNELNNIMDELKIREIFYKGEIEEKENKIKYSIESYEKRIDNLKIQLQKEKEKIKDMELINNDMTEKIKELNDEIKTNKMIIQKQEEELNKNKVVKLDILNPSKNAHEQNKTELEKNKKESNEKGEKDFDAKNRNNINENKNINKIIVNNSIYSYKCLNYSDLSLDIDEGTVDEVKIEIELENNGSVTWKNDTKLKMVEPSEIKVDDINLKQQKPGEKNKYTIVLKLKNYPAKEYILRFLFYSGGNPFGDMIDIEINILNETVKKIKEFRKIYNLSKDRISYEKILNALENNFYDYNAAFSSFYN